MLSAKRDRKAAKSFFKKALSSNHNQTPKIISVD
jgi:transposase-like protein